MKVYGEGAGHGATSSGFVIANNYDNLYEGSFIKFAQTSPSSASGYLVMGSSGSNTLYVTGANVGIGIASPQEKLTVYGHINTQGGLPAMPAGQTMCYGSENGHTDSLGFCSSDRRLKEDIHYLGDEGLSVVMALKPAHFLWKETKLPMVGFIAQDVEKAAEQAVYKGAGGYLGLDTAALLSYSVKAIQELKADNDNQDAEISALREEIKGLKALIH